MTGYCLRATFLRKGAANTNGPCAFPTQSTALATTALPLPTVGSRMALLKLAPFGCLDIALGQTSGVGRGRQLNYDKCKESQLWSRERPRVAASVGFSSGPSSRCIEVGCELYTQNAKAQERPERKLFVRVACLGLLSVGRIVHPKSKGSSDMTLKRYVVLAAVLLFGVALYLFPETRGWVGVLPSSRFALLAWRSCLHPSSSPKIADIETIGLLCC